MDMTDWRDGVRDGVPIGIGYLAVSFGFGIAAASSGLGAVSAGIMSAANMTSAGQFASLETISSHGSFVLLALTQFVINVRYALMSAALSQKISESTGVLARAAMAFYVTDEIFALSSIRRGRLGPMYTLGLATDAAPGWIIGTVLGASAGSVLPQSIMSALGVSLYGMFIAAVLPAAKRDRTIACVAASSALLSSARLMPQLEGVSGVGLTIASAVTVSIAAAIFDPSEGEERDE